jgi:hypothetical protein
MPLTSAAAVFAVVTVALFGFVLNNNNSVQPPPLPPNIDVRSQGTISEDVRILVAQTNEDFIEAHGLSEEQIEMYITFANPMTLEELDLVLGQLASDSNNVQIVTLWHGEVAMDFETQAAGSAAMFFNGARVFANGGLYSTLKDQPEFTWIEFGGELIDESNFTPITIPQGELPETTSPPDTNIGSTEPALGDDPLAPPIEGGDDDPIEINNEDPDIISTNPENPVIVPYEDGFIELDINGATGVNFINGNRFVLTTASQVLLYEISAGADGGQHSLTAVTGFVAVNPQVTYIDPKTGTLLIIGGDAFGRVTNLFIAESESGELIQLDTTIIAQRHEEIRTALVGGGDVILRTRGESLSKIYTASRNGGYMLHEADKTEDILVILGFTSGGFKYARITDGITTTYRYNTVGFYAEENEIGLAELEGTLRFVRSNDGTNFAVITDYGTYIWNAGIRAFTESIETTTVRFHRYSSSIFVDDKGTWHVIQGTEFIPVTEEDANSLAGKPDFSSSYRLFEITPAAVKIEVIAN